MTLRIPPLVKARSVIHLPSTAKIRAGIAIAETHESKHPSGFPSDPGWVTRGGREPAKDGLFCRRFDISMQSDSELWHWNAFRMRTDVELRMQGRFFSFLFRRAVTRIRRRPGGLGPRLWGGRK